MSSNPKVSIVTPTYNYSNFIEEAIISASSQTYPNIEIVVVDDGSTDETPEILKRLTATVPSLNVLRTEHRGVSHARNLGTEAANGEYIAFLDADDLWHPTKIAKQVAALREHDNDPRWCAVYCLFRRIDITGRLITNGPAWQTRGYCYASHLITNHIGNGSSMMVRRDVLRDIGGFNESYRLCEDHDLQLRILRNNKIELVREYLVGYRFHTQSATSQYVALADALIAHTERHVTDELIPEPLRSAARVAAQRYAWHKYLRGGQNWSALIALAKSLHEEPRTTLTEVSALMVSRFSQRLARRDWMNKAGAIVDMPLFTDMVPEEGVPSSEGALPARLSARFRAFDEELSKVLLSDDECIEGCSEPSRNASIDPR